MYSFASNHYNLTMYHLDTSTDADIESDQRTYQEFRDKYDLYKQIGMKRESLDVQLLDGAVDPQTYENILKIVEDGPKIIKDFREKKVTFVIYIVKPGYIFELPLEVTSIKEFRTARDQLLMKLVENVRQLYVKEIIFRSKFHSRVQTGRVNLVTVAEKDTSVVGMPKYILTIYDRYMDVLSKKNLVFFMFDNAKLLSPTDIARLDVRVEKMHTLVSQKYAKFRSCPRDGILPGFRYLRLSRYIMDGTKRYGKSFNPMPLTIINISVSSMEFEKHSNSEFFKINVVSSKILAAFVNENFLHFVENFLRGADTVRAFAKSEERSELQHVYELLVACQRYCHTRRILEVPQQPGQEHVKERAEADMEKYEREFVGYYASKADQLPLFAEHIDNLVKLYVHVYFDYKPVSDVLSFRNNLEIRKDFGNFVKDVFDRVFRDAEHERLLGYSGVYPNFTSQWSGKILNEKELEFKDQMLAQTSPPAERLRSILHQAYEDRGKFYFLGTQQSFVYSEIPVARLFRVSGHKMGVSVFEYASKIVDAGFAGLVVEYFD